MSFYNYKLSAGRQTWFFGISNTVETSGNRNQGSNGPLTQPTGLAESHRPACGAGLLASPADLLSPDVEQQIRGRQAKDHAVYGEAAGIGHEEHALK